MRPRIGVICAIVAFVTSGDRALAQFPITISAAPMASGAITPVPGCAYMSVTNPCPFSVDPQAACQPGIDPEEACQDCPPGAQVFYVQSFRKDGPVKVTIRVEFWDVVPGSYTFTDQVLTLAPGEVRKLGCSLRARPHYTWSVETCQPL
jgi:hypothetical protein